MKCLLTSFTHLYNFGREAFYSHMKTKKTLPSPTIIASNEYVRPELKIAGVKWHRGVDCSSTADLVLQNNGFGCY
jgi:hypothetical protein